MSDLISRQAALDAIKKLEKPAPTAQHLSAIFDCEDTIKALPSAQPSVSKAETVGDVISRQAAIDAIDRLDIPEDMCVFEILSHIELEIGNLPSAQPDYQEVLGWLLAYHTKSFDLHGRYMAHEVIGWLVHDFAIAYMTERREE